jgi:hypothetical protein
MSTNTNLSKIAHLFKPTDFRTTPAPKMKTLPETASFLPNPFFFILKLNPLRITFLEDRTNFFLRTYEITAKGIKKISEQNFFFEDLEKNSVNFRHFDRGSQTIKFTTGQFRMKIYSIKIDQIGKIIRQNSIITEVNITDTQNYDPNSHYTSVSKLIVNNNFRDGDGDLGHIMDNGEFKKLFTFQNFFEFLNKKILEKKIGFNLTFFNFGQPSRLTMEYKKRHQFIGVFNKNLLMIIFFDVRARKLLKWAFITPKEVGMENFAPNMVIPLDDEYNNFLVKQKKIENKVFFKIENIFYKQWMDVNVLNVGGEDGEFDGKFRAWEKKDDGMVVLTSLNGLLEQKKFLYLEDGDQFLEIEENEWVGKLAEFFNDEFVVHRLDSGLSVSVYKETIRVLGKDEVLHEFKLNQNII